MKVIKEQREITRQYCCRFQKIKKYYFVLNPIFYNKPRDVALLSMLLLFVSVFGIVQRMRKMRIATDVAMMKNLGTLLIYELLS